jgi:ABC-type transport system involved in multi-copper enzyme maturation permease subunit
MLHETSATAAAEMPSQAAADKPAPPPPAAKIEQTWLRIESFLDRAGDLLNPILVKEARQAMKSRQFVVTFSLLLIFGWLWTVIFIALSVPDIFFAPVGPAVLTGYYVVLSIPLLIVVPYASFRSLAGEREDGTYELLSITSLSARQIILGKLGSAILQMIVYYSALAPCIAFTYLLRGIDVLTIATFLTYSFLASLLLSIVGLMMATVTRARHWQVLLSVVFVMALLVFTFVWDFVVLAFIVNRQTPPFDQPDFWIGNLCGLSFYLALIALLLMIGAGQITFASENRSGPIRIMLVIFQILIVGWFTYYWVRFEVGELLFIEMGVIASFWAIVGAFLTGETAQLSPRAMRQLPQSFLGRMAFTWFNPGSGTGYVFAMLNLLGALVAAWTGITVAWMTGFEYQPDLPDWYYFSACLVGYVLGYLGLVRLVVVALRRVTHVGMLATFLCQVIVASGAVLFPYLLHVVSVWGDFTNSYYSILQLPNWIWTLYEVVERTTFGGMELAIFVASAGASIFLINLIVAAREVEHVRTAAPERVAQDELALHPEQSPHRKKNPWDES